MSLSILHIGAFAFPGPSGDAGHLRATARALALAGNAVVIACFHAGSGDAPREADVVRGPRLPASRRAQVLLLARAVARVLSQRRIDVVHAHGLDAALVARVARGVGVAPPIVLDRVGVEGGLAARLASGGVDTVVAATPEEREVLQRRGWQNVVVISPGVDALEWTEGRADRARARWALGGGTWVLQLGEAPEFASEVAARTDAGVLALGASPVGFDPARVRVIGLSDLADALAVVALAGVGDSGSRFPHEILAPLARGVPVVAPRAPAIPGVLSPGSVAGWLADPEGRAALGQAARHAIAAGYTSAMQASRLGALYAERLGR